MMAATSSSRRSSAIDSYVGCVINLISSSEIRYQGILHLVDHRDCVIALRDVRPFGTEGRKMDGPQIPPSARVYDYMLFRRADIKSLRVLSSPVHLNAQVNTDPSVIQSQYPCRVNTSTSLPSAVRRFLPCLNSHTAQFGLRGSNFQGPLPLYQPRGSIRSLGASPHVPNAYHGRIVIPAHWQGYYVAPVGRPQLHQPSLLRPPPGLSMASSMQPPMRYLNLSPFRIVSYLTPPSALSPAPALSMQQPFRIVSSNLPPARPVLPPPPALSPAPALSMQQPMQYLNLSPSFQTVSSNFPPALAPAPAPAPAVSLAPVPAVSLAPALSSGPSVTLPCEGLCVTVTNMAPDVSTSTVALAACRQSLTPLTSSGPLNALVPAISRKPNATSGSSLPYQAVSQLSPAVIESSSSIHTETPACTLVTPGQLLNSGPTIVSSAQPLQTPHKDGVVVQVSSTSSCDEPSLPVSAETKPSILPLQVTSGPSHKPGEAHYQTRRGYSYKYRGKGIWEWRPVAKLTNDFDFMAMNKKFRKDEVWAHFGKSNKSHAEGDNDDLSNVKPVYNKDDFFDSLSSGMHDNSSLNRKTRHSKQMKIDAETFGDSVMYCCRQGGRGPGNGGRTRVGYSGRRGGYGHNERGRWCSKPNRKS